MKNLLFGLILLVLFGINYTLKAQTTQTVLIDFGDVLTTEPGWNNVTNPNAGTAVNLNNSSGNTTGLVLTVTDAFAGINNNGDSAVSSLNIPITGSGDSFYGNTGTYSGKIETSGEVEISNLDPGVSYTFTIFSSRSGVTDNRETNYTVIGATSASLQLNASNNTTNTVTFNDIVPAGDGTIKIRAEKGVNNSNSYGFFYLGYINMTYQKNEEPANKSVNIIYPNGGGAFRFAQEAYVVWESTNITYLNIDFSINNGSTWFPIASSVSTVAGYYIWTVPYVLTNTCLVRVTDASNSSISDVSDATFKIISNRKDSSEVYSITVLSPNQGELYHFGEICTINWFSTYISDINIDYSTDNGSNWNVVANSIPAADGSFLWTIPSVASDNCLIQLSNASNDTLFEVSGAFQIVSNSIAGSKIIQIDFGDETTLENGWNNLSVNETGAAINLVDSQGNLTNFTLELTDRFSGINNEGGIAQSGLNIPSTGSGDSFFGNDVLFYGELEPTGEVRISNLDPSLGYSFSIFASRSGVSDNRDTKYTVTGASSTSVLLNTTDNTSNVAIVSAMYPAIDGTIRIKAEKGPNNTNSYGFYYLGTIKMAYTPQTTPNKQIIYPIQIDFGNLPTSEIGWNNMGNPLLGANTDLVDAEGNQTGLTLTITDAFNSINNNGTAANDSLNIPATGSGDSFFGNDVNDGGIEPTGEVQFSNLNDSLSYSFTIFASRAGVSDNRETKYTVIGASTQMAYLNVANNTSNVALVEGIVPLNGNISIKAEKGPNNTNPSGYYYLGVIKMVASKTNTASAINLDLTALNINDSCTFALSGISSAQQVSNTGSLNFIPDQVPGTATLLINQSGVITNMQFDVDETGNISNVKIEVEGQYIPLYQGFYDSGQNELTINQIDGICIYSGN